MKLFNGLLTILVFGMNAFAFLACGDDDGGSTGQFFAIAVDGTQTVIAFDKIAVSSNGEFCFVSGGDDIDFMLVTYSDMDKLTSSPKGEYRFCPSSGVENLDLEIGLIEKDSYISGKSGKHNVTSVKRKNDEVFIEGNFSGVLDDGSVVRGKYRLAVF